MFNNILENYFIVKQTYYTWRNRTAVIYKLALALGFAGITGLLAQVRITLPWTPVPIVASQFGVILAAVLLGKRWGGISMILYAVLGFAGIPWFTGLKGGLSVLMGPTAGYMIGYILSAFFIGHYTDLNTKSRKILPLFGMIIFSQIVILYIPGLIQLGLWTALVKGNHVNIATLLQMGYFPFLVGDTIKSAVCTLAVKGLMPNEDCAAGMKR